MPVERERLFDCEPFRLCDYSVKRPSQLEPQEEPRVLVCIGGSGQLEHTNIPYAVGKGTYGSCLQRPESVHFNPARK